MQAYFLLLVLACTSSATRIQSQRPAAAVRRNAPACTSQPSPTLWDFPALSTYRSRLSQDDPGLAASSSTTTASPKLSCALREASPGGATSPVCICNDSITAPILSTSVDESSSCAYSTTPTKTVAVTTPYTSFTSKCHLCSQAENWADGNSPTCEPTTIKGCTTPTPKIAAEVSYDPVHIGNANFLNGGYDFRHWMYGNLSEFCPPPAAGKPGACDPTKVWKLSNVFAVWDKSVWKGTISVTIDGSQYDSLTDMEAMLALAVSSFDRAATNGSCRAEPYDYRVSDVNSDGCESYGAPGDSHISSRLGRRGLLDYGAGVGPMASNMSLDARDEPDSELACTGTLMVCDGPSYVHIEQSVDGQPYADHLHLSVGWKWDKSDSLTFDWFDCAFFISGLMDLVAFVLPEFGEVTAAIDLDVNAICAS